MNITIKAGVARGRVMAPPSKSMAHRLLIAGALSGGSEISHLAWSQDIKATLSCLQALGAQAEVVGDTIRIGGLSPAAATPNDPLYCCESGSTLRFFIPLCLLSSSPITLTGEDRLMQRPLGVYADICAQNGLRFEQDGNALTVCGPLTGGTYTVPGDISSQFITGLLFALPLAPKDSVIRIVGNIESQSYIDLTLKALTDFGITLFSMGSSLLIPGGQTYRPRQTAVEGDWSNAAFLDAFNLFGGEVTVEGLDDNSPQGDRVYRQLFAQLDSDHTDPIDLTDCPDLAPILFAVAAAKNGGVFTGTARLKIKECDRAAAMQEELAKFGVPVQVEDNRVIVQKATLHAPNAPLDAHNDHRIVMALSVLCSITGGEIVGAQAVAKSYPDFFSIIRNLGIEAQEL